MLRRVLRPRVLLYTAILWAIILAAGVALYERVPVKVDVIRDRVASRQDSDEAENVYRLQVMNTTEAPRRFVISVAGLEDIEIEDGDPQVDIGPASSRMIPVRVEVDREHARKGANPIVFTVRTVDDGPPVVITEKASFVVQ
jgi:polyferredoxin